MRTTPDYSFETGAGRTNRASEDTENIDLRRLLSAGEADRAKSICEKRAMDDPEANYILGRIYEAGLGSTEQDKERALFHYRKAVEKAHDEEMRKEITERITKIRKDLKKSKGLFGSAISTAKTITNTAKGAVSVLTTTGLITFIQAFAFRALERYGISSKVITYACIAMLIVLFILFCLSFVGLKQAQSRRPALFLLIGEVVLIVFQTFILMVSIHINNSPLERARAALMNRRYEEALTLYSREEYMNSKEALINSGYILANGLTTSGQDLEKAIELYEAADCIEAKRNLLALYLKDGRYDDTTYELYQELIEKDYDMFVLYLTKCLTKAANEDTAVDHLDGVTDDEKAAIKPEFLLQAIENGELQKYSYNVYLALQLWVPGKYYAGYSAPADTSVSRYEFIKMSFTEEHTPYLDWREYNPVFMQCMDLLEHCYIENAEGTLEELPISSEE